MKQGARAQDPKAGGRRALELRPRTPFARSGGLLAAVVLEGKAGATCHEGAPSLPPLPTGRRGRRATAPSGRGEPPRRRVSDANYGPDRRAFSPRRGACAALGGRGESSSGIARPAREWLVHAMRRWARPAGYGGHR